MTEEIWDDEGIRAFHELLDRIEWRREGEIETLALNMDEGGENYLPEGVTAERLSYTKTDPGGLPPFRLTRKVAA